MVFFLLFFFVLYAVFCVWVFSSLLRLPGPDPSYQIKVVSLQWLPVLKLMSGPCTR